VLEGLEKAERNVLPVLNNLLENREMQLEDGRFLMSAERYDKLLQVWKCCLDFRFYFFSPIFLVVQQYCYEGESTYESNGGNLTKVSMVFSGCYVG